MKIPSNYKNARIRILNSLPGAVSRWIASWIFDNNLNPIILLEKYYVEKLKNSKKKGIANQSLNLTLEHEYQEAILALQILKEQGYSEDYIKQTMAGMTPENEEAVDLAGGKAHEQLTGEDRGDYSYYRTTKQLDDELGIDYLTESELLEIRRRSGVFTER